MGQYQGLNPSIVGLRDPTRNLPPHQRLVLDPLRLIRIYAFASMQIRLVLLVVPLKPRRVTRCSILSRRVSQYRCGEEAALAQIVGSAWDNVLCPKGGERRVGECLLPRVDHGALTSSD